MQLLKLDDTDVEKHRDLELGDKCYYWRHYTVGKGFVSGETNNLILNFKIPPTQTKRIHYKNEAISKIANEFVEVITKDSTYENFTFIPIPPSKAKSEEDYDDRLIRVLNIVYGIKKIEIHVRKLVIQNQTTMPSHLSQDGYRISVDELLKLYVIEDTLLLPKPKQIIIFDDVLTKGSHFRAMKIKLEACYGNIPIFGIFVARSINENNFIS